MGAWSARNALQGGPIEGIVRSPKEDEDSVIVDRKVRKSMAFDVKELMIDISKARAQLCYGASCYGGTCYGGTCYGGTPITCYGGTCHPTVQCYGGTPITCYGGTCHPTPCYGGTCYGGTCYGGTCHPTITVTCRLGTYTCIDTRITCTGTGHCYGTEPPTTIIYEGVDQETFKAMKEQLTSALREIEAGEKQLEAAKKKTK
jgi:hypothetical protein